MGVPVTRTYVASIKNHQQVRDDLDSLGFAASKLWNTARWTCERVWSETGTIPEDGTLKAYLKKHERYADLNSQSSQRVIEELAEAFHGWYAKRRNGDDRANPPTYRKRGDQHPRSTVTFKSNGFKHDQKNNRIRLSKGKNLKNYWTDFILCEYDARPDVIIENIRQVRAVWKNNSWELHIVCQHEIETSPPGDETVGIDLGISNFAALSYSTSKFELYPGNKLKEDERYFERKIRSCQSKWSNQALRLRRKRSLRRKHYLHSITRDIVDSCIEQSVGTISIGQIQSDDDESEFNTFSMNLFDRFTDLLTYKAKEKGIKVVQVSEVNTSQICANCEIKRKSNRIERGLYICKECGLTINCDINGAENIRLKLNKTEDVTPNHMEDRSNGRVARPVVNLFQRGENRPSYEQGMFV